MFFWKGLVALGQDLTSCVGGCDFPVSVLTAQRICLVCVANLVSESLQIIKPTLTDILTPVESRAGIDNSKPLGLSLQTNSFFFRTRQVPDVDNGPRPDRAETFHEPIVNKRS